MNHKKKDGGKNNGKKGKPKKQKVECPKCGHEFSVQVDEPGGGGKAGGGGGD